MSLPSRIAQLHEIADEICACKGCPLASRAGRAVPGEGAHDAFIMFIGEAPGEEEDRQGRPFVGPAGQLLERAIRWMGWSRQSVFIGNIIKCRPPENRSPQIEEVQACESFIHRQIAAVEPKVIVALGNVAMRALCGQELRGIMSMRGRWLEYEPLRIAVMPTFHPSFVLRMPSAKACLKTDLGRVRRRLEAQGLCFPRHSQVSASRTR